MAGFDPNLDKELFAEDVTIGNQRLKVAVMSYNDGEAKLQIMRERLREDGGGTFAKLGRMTVDEVAAVMPLMQKAYEYLQQNKPAEEAPEGE
jgi:hypothetical protein